MNIREFVWKNWSCIPELYDTIQYNVHYGNLAASDEEVVEMVDLYDAIINMPNQWNIPVGERGLKLPGVYVWVSIQSGAQHYSACYKLARRKETMHRVHRIMLHALCNYLYVATYINFYQASFMVCNT